MPGVDRTGPLGWGPMTGRAAGFCAGYSVPGYMNPVWGRGAGFGGRGWFGRGGGRGFRNRFFATGLTGWQRAGMGWGYSQPFGPVEMSSEQETAFLRDHVKSLEEEMKRAQERLAELEKGDATQ